MSRDTRLGLGVQTHPEPDISSRLARRINSIDYSVCEVPIVELAEQWIEAQREDLYGIDVKITGFEHMITDSDQLFTDIFEFYGISGNRLVTEVLASVKQPFNTSNTNKKRGSDVNEWEEYFCPSLKRDALI